MKRRDFIKLSAAAATLGNFAAPAFAQGARQRVVVLGGGFAGATCAKYLRIWSPSTEVVLVDSSPQFVSCPMSNRVINGTMSLRDLTRSRGGLAARYGVELVRGRASLIDAMRKELRLVSGETIAYDRLVVAPGIDFMYENMPGLESASAQDAMPHGWIAGPQTNTLRQQVMALGDGGVFAMHIPLAPYRCPPGTYERACLVANVIRRNNRRAKVLVFDSNPGIVAKSGLFTTAFQGEYRDIIEYVPNARFESASASEGMVNLDIMPAIKADVWNVIPPQRAPVILRTAGLIDVDDRWCSVDFRSYESLAAPGIHVIGDAIASAPGTPKSGHMANQQAKVCAGAIAALLAGREPPMEPIIANTCYSFVNDNDAIHIASVYRYDAEAKTMVAVDGAGGLSAASSAQEGFMAIAWAFNIFNDTLS